MQHQLTHFLCFVIFAGMAFGCMPEDPLSFPKRLPDADKTLDPGLKRIDSRLELGSNLCLDNLRHSNCEVRPYEGACEDDTDCEGNLVCEVRPVSVEVCSTTNDERCTTILRHLPKCTTREPGACAREIDGLSVDSFCNEGEEAYLGQTCESVVQADAPGHLCIQEVIALECGSFYSIACVRDGSEALPIPPPQSPESSIR